MSYKLPPVTHGVFMSVVTQTYTGSTTTATSNGQPVYFDTSVDADSGVSLSGSTAFIVTSAGDYLFNISAILDQTTGTNVSYEIWFMKNGSIVTDSNTRITNATATAEQVLAVPFIIDLLAAEYISLRWYCTAASGTIKATPAVGSVRPRTPSIIVSINKISE